jgi:DNA-3-methyladenine glycosylase II
VLTERTFANALADLANRDRHLAAAVSKWGSPPFWTHPAGFAGIVLAILAQQVSIESAQAAFSKLEAEIEVVRPSNFLLLDDLQLRAAGFSRQKASYVRGVAMGIVDGELDLAALGSLDDGRVRESLMAIRGIGRWTADTYLLFSLRRPDAWPSGDLALAKSMQEVMRLPETPSYEAADHLADSWRPWRAVAARILWHSYLSERGRADDPGPAQRGSDPQDARQARPRTG